MASVFRDPQNMIDRGKIFKFLHHPTNSRSSHTYHCFMISLFCTHSAFDYIYKTRDELLEGYDKDKDFGQENNDQFYLFSCAVLFGILSIEMSVRLWSAQTIESFRFPPFSGLRSYFSYHYYRRTLDVFNLLIYLYYIVAFNLSVSQLHLNIVRVLCTFEIFQANRMIHPNIKVICRSIIGHIYRYLQFVLFVCVFFGILCASFIFLLEHNNSGEFSSLFTVH